MKITFYTVKTPQEKLARITNLVSQYFNRGNRILILVPNVESAKFIDELLWRQPEESFLPHSTSIDPITIATNEENINKAQVLLNLGPKVPAFSNQFEIVCELLDATHPEKHESSKKKVVDYQTLGQPVEVLGDD